MPVSAVSSQNKAARAIPVLQRIVQSHGWHDFGNLQNSALFGGFLSICPQAFEIDRATVRRVMTGTRRVAPISVAL